MKKLFSTKYSDSSFAFATLVMRLGFGLTIIPYGFRKLVNFSKYAGNFTDPFHIGHTASLVLVIFAEFFCGALIVMGLLTRLACIPLVIAMAVALGYVNHWDIFGRGQDAAIFLSGFLALLFVGPGKISVDKLIGK
jgi:putative oxidoreductase